MSIEILASDVVDQIAAGEVVERPSHLVKELVENSLDAGATKITVEFSDGGKSVRVIDNGCGIGSKDLQKALFRHATSKIKVAKDLWSLSSFGFRGEALASISAVSHLTLISKTAETGKAYRLQSVFGAMGPVEEVGGSPGTSISITELFKNIPARLKFLKSDAAESAAIKSSLKALALAHPGTEFAVHENGKLVLFYSAVESRKQRAEQVFEMSALYEGSAERENVRAFAVFADPHRVAKTSKNIWIFAQNRWIQDRGLQAAVMEAYRSLLMHGEYPYVAVWVETPPEDIDVNIHPTKSQVKFQNQSLAFRAVQAAIRDSLEKAPWIKSGVEESLKSYSARLAENTFDHRVEFAAPVQGNFASPDLDQTLYAKKSLSEASFIGAVSETRVSYSGPEKIETVSGKRYWSNLDILGQAHLTYILCSRGDALVLVDQHAAHERVAFEKLMNAWKGGKIDVQEFLFPLAIDLSPEKIEALSAYFSEFEKMGISFELLGPETLGIKSAPSILKDSAFVGVMDSLAADIVDKGGSFRFEKVMIDIFATMACHSVVRAGQALSIPEMKALLMAMDEFPLSSFCPHGRPVSIEYPYAQIEKSFGRTL